MEASRGSTFSFACALNRNEMRTELLVDSIKHDSRLRVVAEIAVLVESLLVTLSGLVSMQDLCFEGVLGMLSLVKFF